jgi:hypothetical protein
MPITRLFPRSCTCRCDGCGSIRTLDFDQLEIGVVPTADQAHPTCEAAAPVVALPPCDLCGAIELLGDFDNPRPTRLRLTADVHTLLLRLGVEEPGHADHDLHPIDL